MVSSKLIQLTPNEALIVYGYNHRMLYKTIWALDKIISLLIIGVIITGDLPRITNQTDQVRQYTSAIEFDYPNWVWDAIWTKIDQSAISAPYTFNRGSNKPPTFRFCQTSRSINRSNWKMMLLNRSTSPHSSSRLVASVFTQPWWRKPPTYPGCSALFLMNGLTTT